MIDTVPYDETKIQGWINAITELVMEDLLGLNKPFKWVGERKRLEQQFIVFFEADAQT